MSTEMHDAVRNEIMSQATDAEALTYAEVYDFDDDQIAECMRLHNRAVITVTFPDEDVAL